jgi:hypothetical protein
MLCKTPPPPVVWTIFTKIVLGFHNWSQTTFAYTLKALV